MIGNSNDETNFPHKLLFTDTQVSKIRKAFANGSSTNKKLLKTQLYKTVQSRKFIPLETFFRRDRMIEKVINYANKFS